MADVKGHVRYLSKKLDSDEDDDDDEKEGDLLSDDDKKEIERIAGDVLELAMEGAATGGVITTADERKHAVAAKLALLVKRTKARSRVGDRVDEDRRYARARAALGPKEK